MASKATDKATGAPDPARWLQEYGDILYRYALLRLHDADRAEDMVQETLLAALQARTGYSGRASEKTWLIGILKHKIVDTIRKQVRETTVNDIHGLTDAAAYGGMEELFDARGRWLKPPQDWGRPDKALHRHQLIEFLKLCLAQLKPAHAQIFSLKEISGQSIDEICNGLGISATNCSVMLYRARMSLRRCLEVQLADDNPGHD
jgi:RNA polymerase sigma-70 factor (ECF subfamily)